MELRFQLPALEVDVRLLTPCPSLCGQESDLTGQDFDELDPSASTHLLARAPGASSSVSLYPYIDQQRSYALNTQQPPLGLPLIIRPHHTRNTVSVDESLSSLEQSDPELIIHLAFTQLVRIRTLLVSIGRGEEAPRLCRVWTNCVDGIAFEDVDDRKPDQEWELCEADGAVDYPTRVSKFQSVSSLTFLFVSPLSAEISSGAIHLTKFRFLFFKISVNHLVVIVPVCSI